MQDLLDKLEEDEKAAFALMDESWADLERTEAELEEQRETPVRRMPWRRWVTAAAVLILAAGGGYLWLSDKTVADRPATTAIVQDVQPGHTGSVLRLADGRIIDLNKMPAGLIARQGPVEIYKDASGGISYRGLEKATEPVYNEVTTARAEEQSLTLPDGSHITLNASSSVRYPLVFTGADRTIILTGEAYAQVVHDANKPFRIRVKDQLIEDIGTEFNINAYDDAGSVVTTVAEGSVSVRRGAKKFNLMAGEQTNGVTVSAANLKLNLAWYKGFFSYEHATIPAVMKDLARWYNIEVKYEGNIPDETFTGSMNRKLTLSEALEGIRSIGIRYRLEEGKRIVILP